LLRLQSSTRTFAETPNEVLTYSCIKNNSFVGECEYQANSLENAD
jgi:hypothetical protein